MPELRLEPAPVSEATTNNIRVEVISLFSRENSRPGQNQWVFQYTIRITNQGLATVKLVSRHWVITDALEHTREIEGPGVIGQQPVLKPGESFKYSSWCPLSTPTGSMHGEYRFTAEEGDGFEAEIAPFGLRAPHTVH